MSGIDDIIGVIMGIFLVIVLFFMVLPEIASITKTNIMPFYLLGVLLIIALILSLFKR